MFSRNSHVNIILLSADRTIQRKFERDLKQSSVPAALTIARDLPSLQRAASKKTFDGVILETKRGETVDFVKLQQLVDPSRTFILAGGRESLLQTTRILSADVSGGSDDASTPPNRFLEDYFEAKLGDFVNGMKLGSAKGLHPMLIKTVERPLIAHALKVTNGNQIQTAHLLGMNRNTLRKKITELRIPIPRQKRHRA